MLRLISGVLAAASVATVAPACAPRDTVRIERIVATPIVTRRPSPRPVAKAQPSPPRRSDAARAPVARHDDVDGIPFVWMEIADCESGDGPLAFGPPFHPHWAFHDKDYDGGLNFTYDTWDSAWAHAASLRDAHGRPLVSGPSLDAWEHSAGVQVLVAEQWLAVTSWGQWPACSKAIGLR